MKDDVFRSMFQKGFESTSFRHVEQEGTSLSPRAVLFTTTDETGDEWKRKVRKNENEKVDDSRYNRPCAECTGSDSFVGGA